MLSRVTKSIETKGQSTLLRSASISVIQRAVKPSFTDNINANYNGNRVISTPQKIQPVEELSDFAQRLARDCLFKVDSTESLQKVYAGWAETYDADSGAMKFDSLQTMREKVVKYLMINNVTGNGGGANILDVGCGTGKLGELVMESAGSNINRIDGMDLTQEMLDFLETNRGDIYNKVQQHNISETEWPFESDKYDLTVCNAVLVYVKENVEAVLEEFIRVTKPGGYCLLMLRHDALGTYSHHIYQLITDGKLALSEITKARWNFVTKIDGKHKYFVPYNHHIFQVL